MRTDTPVDVDLESFRRHVVALPMRQGSKGWEFTRKPDVNQKKVLLEWIKSVLSYDEYGYPKPEDLLPDETEIKGMYQGLFLNAIDNVRYRKSASYALVLLPCWLGKKQKQINYFMGYDEEDFQGPPEFGTMAYYAPITEPSQILTRFGKGQTDPVKFLHQALSEADAKMAYHQWDHSKNK